MPEFFTVLPPDQALERLRAHLSPLPAEILPLSEALGRALGQPIIAPEPLPAFPRSTVDGYAVRAADTFGATEGLPAYLRVIGEVPMGQAAGFTVGAGQAALIHTGGALPEGADAVVMLERTQRLDAETIEVLRPVAPGENVLAVGEDIQEGEVAFPASHRLRPQDLGALAALGMARVPVARRPRVAILGSGDEIVPPDQRPQPGQVRDVNTFSLIGLIRQHGGEPLACGIAPDRLEILEGMAREAFEAADVLVFTAGSSVSTRDLTATVIERLGPPGILAHGLAIRPGKPTLVAFCAGKPVLGLPGNPVSAFVVARMLLVPLLYLLQGVEPPPPRRQPARLTHNIPSAPGRIDWVPVRLIPQADGLWAEPVFGKSNLIFTLARSDGLVMVPLDLNGLQAGDPVDVWLWE
jgi:molybdopterin molybdotransferase